MRKWWLIALVAALALFCLPAAAETYLLDDLRATVDVADTYVVLKSDNLATYAEWLESRGISSETLANEMIERGVLLQCWSESLDQCFELTAVQTDETQNIWDVNEQSESIRRTYRLKHYPDNEFQSLGYEFSSADWKNTAEGRFLILRYLVRDNGEIDHRGFMRRTVRNGYEVTLDMRVYGRAVTNKDNNELNKIWDSFHFVEILTMPPAASAKLNITDIPPTETNSASFTMQGTAAEGLKLTAVVMGLNYPNPVLFSVEVGKSGKFKLPIELPKEGVFLVTVTGEYAGVDVVELAYPVTYQRTLLSVTFATQPGETVTSDTTVFQGTGSPGATLQVFVNNESYLVKKVTAAGKFKIDVDTSKEGDYDVVLAFSKAGLADRRFTFHFTRQWSDADMLRKLASESISPGYATLVQKIDGYDGRTMGYKCYVVDITQSGSEWIVKLAFTKKGGTYRSLILVTANDEPTFKVDQQVMMYGTCAGMSVPAEDSGESYPCFELLKFASVE